MSWRRLALEAFNDEMQELMDLDEQDTQDENKASDDGKDADENMKESSEEKVLDEDKKSPSKESPSKEVEKTKDGEGSSKDVENKDSEDNDIIYFNEDFLCEHGGLSSVSSKRKVIPQEAWEIIRKYFPGSKEYPFGSDACIVCEVSFQSTLCVY